MERLPVETLKNFMEVFKRSGVPEEDAEICSEILIASDLRGIESHGIGRLKMYYDRIKAGIQEPVTRIEVIKDKAATAVWDGNNGMGQVISFRAMETAIEKAKQFGLGAVAVRNSSFWHLWILCQYGMSGKYDWSDLY